MLTFTSLLFTLPVASLYTTSPMLFSTVTSVIVTLPLTLSVTLSFAGFGYRLTSKSSFVVLPTPVAQSTSIVVSQPQLLHTTSFVTMLLVNVLAGGVAEVLVVMLPLSSNIHR